MTDTYPRTSSATDSNGETHGWPWMRLETQASAVFGDRLPLAIQYAEMLVTEGVVRGLIGPREAPRVWERHLLNCGVLAELVPRDAHVVDVGSGAGLPGLVLAVARPDLTVTLVEPLARRVSFLTEAAAMLGLGSVEVLRVRAEQYAGGTGPLAAGHPVDIVTARAVASLGRLVEWCLPLVRRGGRMLALKGATAESEAVRYAETAVRWGGSVPVVRRCGVGVLDEPATVVEVIRERVSLHPVGTSGRPTKRARDGEARAKHHRSRSRQDAARWRPRTP